MAVNTLLTIDMITYEALIVLKNELGLGNRCLRQFDSQFGVEGAKIGDTLRVRKPIRVQTTTGAAPSAQNTQETYVPVAAQTQRNVELAFTTKDTALALDDFRDRIIEPVMAQMASDVDSDGTTVATVGFTLTNSGYVTANYAGSYAGFQGLATPGSIGGVNATSPGPAPWTGVDLGSAAAAANAATKPFFDAQARLHEQSAPRKNRYVVLSPAAAAATQPNLLNLFNPTEEISEMFAQGYIGTMAGAEFYESQNIPLFISGNWTQNSNVQITVTNNASSIFIARVGNGATINAGDQFVMSNATAGVFQVNPLNRNSTGKLAVFTVVNSVTCDSTNGGSALVNVYPQLTNIGQYQTVTILPTGPAAMNVYWMGTSATSTAANFMYEKNALALVVAPLATDLPGAEVSEASDEEDGLALRFVKQYQASTDQLVHRVDILYGWAVVRPELGVRIQA